MRIRDESIAADPLIGVPLIDQRRLTYGNQESGTDWSWRHWKLSYLGA